MDAAVAGLLGASLGAAVGLLGPLLNNWQQRRAEREKRAADRIEMLYKAEREALSELTELIASGTHAISWLVWGIRTRIDDDTEAEVRDYDSRMRELLPKLTGAEVVAAGVSDKAFERISPLVERLYGLDVRIAQAVGLLGDDPDQAAIKLGALGEEAWTLSRETVKEMRTLLRDLPGERAAA